MANNSFNISYNDSHRAQQDYGCATTALCINSTGQFLILNGDHRSGYKNLNFDESLDYFYSHINEASEFSEHGRIFDFNNGNARYVSGGY